jgi:hypothetical protein
MMITSIMSSCCRSKWHDDDSAAVTVITVRLASSLSGMPGTDDHDDDDHASDSCDS